MENFKELYNEYMQELGSYCHNKFACRQYSLKAKYPSKVSWFVESMNWRMTECCKGAALLLEAELVIPSAALIRSALENMAILHHLSKIVNETVANNAVSENLDKELMRFLFVNKYKKGVFIDDSTYDSFHKYKPESVAFYMDAVDEDLKLETEEKISIRNFYSSLCEFVHTNTDGIVGSYSYLDEDSEMIYLGPQMTPTHPLYGAFPSTLLVALDMYLVDMYTIHDNMEEFTRVCEEALKDKEMVKNT